MGYTYNEMDRITENPVQYKFGTGSATEIKNTYKYDLMGRMTESDVYGIGFDWYTRYKDDGSSERVYYRRHSKTTFSDLDANGNPKQKVTLTSGQTSSTATESITYNYLNQLAGKETKGLNSNYSMSPSYDLNGNLIKETYTGTDAPKNSSYAYGLDNQLLYSYNESKHQSITEQVSGNSVTTDYYTRSINKYTYEFGGKLLHVWADEFEKIYKKSNFAFQEDKYFYYSHDGAVAEYLSTKAGTTTTTETKNFTRLGGELLACNSDHKDTPQYFYIQNLRGDVIALIKPDGNSFAIRDYDATGQMLGNDPKKNVDKDPFGFTGGLDAGNGKWKLGARFYDSSKSAFMQQDRYLGDPSDPLSLNRYVYCGLDPVNFVDPTGFKREKTEKNKEDKKEIEKGKKLIIEKYNELKEKYSDPYVLQEKLIVWCSKKLINKTLTVAAVNAGLSTLKISIRPAVIDIGPVGYSTVYGTATKALATPLRIVGGVITSIITDMIFPDPAF